MTESLSPQLPKKVDVLIVNDERDTPSLLNPLSGRIFVTNPVGRRIIELADGSRDVAAIADEITRQFKGASSAQVRGDVQAFLEESAVKGLITWNQSAPTCAS
jgi:hypothetical protein